MKTFLLSCAFFLVLWCIAPLPMLAIGLLLGGAFLAIAHIGDGLLLFILFIAAIVSIYCALLYKCFVKEKENG